MARCLMAEKMKQFRKLNFIVECVFGYVSQSIHLTLSCRTSEESLLTKLQIYFFLPCGKKFNPGTETLVEKGTSGISIYVQFHQV